MLLLYGPQNKITSEKFVGRRGGGVVIVALNKHYHLF